MEFITGTKLKYIFLHNGNWWKLFLKHRYLIRYAIIFNVLKMLSCKTPFLGYHLIICPVCLYSKKIPHSCKSRFCSSCGKKATDIWINHSLNTLPNTKWQHITFTIDSRLWPLFWLNRHIINKIPLISANIVKKLASQHDFLPGVFLAIHSFGRDIKRNIHIHLSTTLGGLRISNNYSSWVDRAFFHHSPLKNIWKHSIISLLLSEFNNGTLILPKSLNHINSFSKFYNWCQASYNKTWNVFLQKPSYNMKRNINYLGKYLKRPPISETRITAFDSNLVSFSFFDHSTKSFSSMSLHALDFIARLISHIPDINFRNIRYYGFLANRVSSKYLPRVYRLLHMSHLSLKNTYLYWKNLIKSSFSYDPTICPFCNSTMLLSHSFFPRGKLSFFHKEIAHGFF